MNDRAKRIRRRVSDALADPPDHVLFACVFGSYGRGHPRKDSDLDLYVVTDAVDERYLCHDPGLAGIDLPSDLPEPHVVAIPPREFAERYYDDDAFLETVLEEGWYVVGAPRDVTDRVEYDPIAE